MPLLGLYDVIPKNQIGACRSYTLRIFYKQPARNTTSQRSISVGEDVSWVPVFLWSWHRTYILMWMSACIYCVGSEEGKTERGSRVSAYVLMATSKWRSTVHTFDALWAHEIHGLVSWILHPWPGDAQLLHNAMEQPLHVCFWDPVGGPWAIGRCWSPPKCQPKHQAR